MKIPKGVSLDIEVIPRIVRAAKARRESTSKWLEDAALQRMEREANSIREQQPVMIPKLPIKKAAQLGAGHDGRRRGRSKQCKTSQDAPRNKTKYKKRGDRE